MCTLAKFSCIKLSRLGEPTTNMCSKANGPSFSQLSYHREKKGEFFETTSLLGLPVSQHVCVNLSKNPRREEKQEGTAQTRQPPQATFSHSPSHMTQISPSFRIGLAGLVIRDVKKASLLQGSALLLSSVCQPSYPILDPIMSFV